MAIIAELGMPFVLGYTGLIYWVFWGKVRAGQHGAHGYRRTSDRPFHDRAVI